MPLFLSRNLLFIHIPKCGGDTIAHHLRTHGDAPFLFVDNGAVMVNGHTPQHMTWAEMLQAGWHTPPNYRVATLVRHPVARVQSEFRYFKAVHPGLRDIVSSPAVFLDAFLEDSQTARCQFDNHNGSILEFLSDERGTLDTSIEIYHIDAMDVLVQSIGLPPVSIADRRNVTLTEVEAAQSQPFTQQDISRIKQRYKEDIDWFEKRFPRLGRTGE